MSFKTIELKNSYESGMDNLIEDFYIPILENAISYDRIAGFFSSSSLAIAARGMAGLIANGGKMRIIASPQLNPNDIIEIEQVLHQQSDFLEKILLNEITEIEDLFERNHVSALGWMLSNNLLEIKIALVLSEEHFLPTETVESKALFHQKVGILTDKEKNQVSFSGSINETASGWLDNVEEFKAFKSWEDGQWIYLNSDIDKFESYWNNRRNNIRILDLPSAVKEKIIKYGENFDIDRISIHKYKAKKMSQKENFVISLFSYQKQAIEKWKQNNRHLLFEMATGSGKTRTAIGCIVELLKAKEKLIVIVSTPQGTLSLQWKNEMESLGVYFDINVIADSTNFKWKDKLSESLLKLNIGYCSNAIVFTTHKTCSSDSFVNIIMVYKKDTKILFIGDEVHGLGAVVSKKGLLDCYDYRIGLSATPNRWFDEFGSTLIRNYFGDSSFEFTIADALSTINPLNNKTFLVNYFYNPFFICLDSEELENYVKLSKKIKKLSKFGRGSNEYQSKLDNLIFQRANINKSAKSKYEALGSILDGIPNVRDTIIFVSDSQLDIVLQMLRDRNIIAHRFTQQEGTKAESKYNNRSERQFIIDKFKEGVFQVLVAIKCLDEGIDIPSATTAIIMASSTNPREYIQRIGRVIRQFTDKNRAYIYDIIVSPDPKVKSNPELLEFEKQIFDKELQRVEDMAKNAINNASALNEIFRVRGEFYEHK